MEKTRGEPYQMNARMGDTHFIIFHRLDRHKKLFLQKEHLRYHAHHRIMNHLKLYLTPTALSLPVNEAPVAFSPALKKQTNWAALMGSCYQCNMKYDPEGGTGGKTLAQLFMMQ